MRDITRLFFKIGCAFFVVFALGCGGGGGSSAGGSSSSGSNTRGTGIRILHGAIDAEPVELFSSLKDPKIGDAFFGQSTFYSPLNTEVQVLTLKRSFSPIRTISSINLAPERNAKYSLLLYGNRETFGLSASLITDAKPELPSGGSAVRIVHALVGAGSLTAEISGTNVSDGTLFGTASDYVIVSPGDLVLSIKRQTDQKQVFSGFKAVQAGRFYTYFVTGEVDYFTVVRDLID